MYVWMYVFMLCISLCTYVCMYIRLHAIMFYLFGKTTKVFISLYACTHICMYQCSSSARFLPIDGGAVCVVVVHAIDWLTYRRSKLSIKKAAKFQKNRRRWRGRRQGSARHDKILVRGETAIHTYINSFICATLTLVRNHHTYIHIRITVHTALYTHTYIPSLIH